MSNLRNSKTKLFQMHSSSIVLGIFNLILLPIIIILLIVFFEMKTGTKITFLGTLLILVFSDFSKTKRRFPLNFWRLKIDFENDYIQIKYITKEFMFKKSDISFIKYMRENNIISINIQNKNFIIDSKMWKDLDIEKKYPSIEYNSLSLVYHLVMFGGVEKFDSKNEFLNYVNELENLKTPSGFDIARSKSFYNLISNINTDIGRR